MPHPLDRRSLLASAAALALSGGSPPPLATAADDRDWSGRKPVRYPDADIVVLDKRFAKYKIGNAAIERLHTGLRWAEGPAWCGIGNFFLCSDIPNDRQIRILDEDGHVSVFRKPA